MQLTTRAALLLFVLAGNLAQADDNLLMNLKPQHPRLIASDSTWQDLQARRKQSPTLDLLLDNIDNQSRALLDAPPLEHQLTGRRLLEISRTAFKRIVLWSFDYRLTGDKKFKDRAEQEMLAMAAFPDWNPSHFLDVGEMTAAMAIGYDWLYADLSPASRATIRQAIVEKGLKPGLDPGATTNWWYNNENNWNQVCFGGLTLGALAIAEDEPKLAEQVLENARTYNPHGLHPYAPEGVYPEGPGYWDYGTTYEVILLSALESALGTDWNLSQSPGFLATADYPLEVTGPTGLVFDYSDSSEKGFLQPALFWFAKKLKQDDILYFQYPHLLGVAGNKLPIKPNSSADRFLPLLAIWAGDLEKRSVPDRPLSWFREGINPLVVFRSSWSDPNALFLALKGGTASANHGHMDAGSFVFDADGVRWAKDLGAQDYESLESKGVKLWSSGQEGGRWTVFRLNNFSHNTLTINGQLHQVQGRAEIVRFSGDPANSHAVVDLTPVFAGQADKVVRGFKMLPNRQVLIQDKLTGLKPNDLVRWAFVTGAQVTVNGRQATLTQKGKTLQIALDSPQDGKFEVIPADPPNDGYDASNPGASILIANLHAPASGKLVIQTLLQPGEKPLSNEALPQTSCEDWSAPLPPKTP
jgi:hypothetical protein